MKLNHIIYCAFVSIFATVLLQECKTTDFVPSPVDGVIKGAVFALVFDRNDDKSNNKGIQIFLPEVTVTITDVNGNILDAVLTKLDGSYQTKKIKIGNHKLCLSKPGFINTCYDIAVSDVLTLSGFLKINFESNDYVWGTAKLIDGASGYYKQAVFGVDIFTKVKVETPFSTREEKCNIFGYYLILDAHKDPTGTITVTCQNAVAVENLNNRTRIDLTFKNTNPVLSSITAYNNSGKLVLRTKPNENLKLVVSTMDAENNALSFKWIPYGDFPGFVTQNANTVNWQLPNKPGRYQMDVMIFDSLGGVDYKSFNIVAGDETVNFSGIVTEIGTSARIANAKITVNANFSTTTDVNGYFSIQVPQGPQERYVLNVEKPGYSLCSKIYYKDAVAKEYQLVRATTETFNPTNDIVIVEREDEYTKFKDTLNQRGPARVIIPKNSIVDSAGKVVTVPVNVSVRAIDILNPKGLLPGDYGAIQGGQDKRLESFGAVDVQIRDNAQPGIKYNLKPGTAAVVESPIFSSLQSAAPASITLWDYNDKTGLWEDIGTAVRSGNFYKEITDKFSVLNADIAFSNATLMQLIDNTNNPIGNRNVIVQIFNPSASGGANFTHEILVNGGNPSEFPIIVPRLAPNVIVTIKVLLASDLSTLNILNVQTGNPVSGAENYDPSGTSYNLSDPNVITVKLLPDIPNLAAVLNRFLIGEENANGVTDADKYYTLIGAYDYLSAGHHITFDEWKTKNGFPLSGTGVVDAIYYNAGDLKFWRSMHQISNAGTIAYYVSNYSTDLDALIGAPPIATVCMEYSPITSGINVTKFYVFNGTGDLVNRANLDQNGDKFIPGLCMTCHGGEPLNDYSSFASGADLQAEFTSQPQKIPKFLPFDAKSFFYSSATGNKRADMEDRLRQLNNTVLSTNATTAIIDYVNASYNGNLGSVGQAYNDNAVVSGWNTGLLPINGVDRDQFYINVVGTTCRTCHIARTVQSVRFETEQQFLNRSGQIFNYVCEESISPTFRLMPNAKVTFENFWTSQAPFRPNELAKFLSLGGNLCQ